MRQQFKVLGAILALNEFTVKDLSEYGDVGKATVRTVLNRERDLIERIGEEPTGRRGGAYAKYRLRADKVEELRERIWDIHKDLPLPPAIAGEANIGESEVPLGIKAAEDCFLRVFPESEPAEKKRLLEAMDLLFEDTRKETAILIGAESNRVDAPQLKVRLENAEWLRDLASAEIDLESRALTDTSHLNQVMTKLKHISRELQRLGKGELATEIIDRTYESPIHHAVSRAEQRRLQEEEERIAGIVGKMRLKSITVLDGIQGEDNLTPKIVRTLQDEEPGIRTFVVEGARQAYLESRSKGVMRFTSVKRDSDEALVVTVDSQEPEARAVLKSAWESYGGDHAIVLDRSFNNGIRNLALELFGNYQGTAVDLTGSVVAEQIKRRMS